MTEIIIFVVAAAAGAAILRNKWRQAQADDEREAEVWHWAARKLDGKVLRPSGMRVELAGVRATFSTEQSHGGSTPQYFVRLKAGPLVGIPGVKMRVSGKSLLGSLAEKALHREVDVDDETFSKNVSVTGRPAPVIRAFFDRMTRLRVEEVNVAFRIDDDELSMELEGRPQDTAPLLKLARYAQTLIERWNTLARMPVAIAEALELDRVDAFDRDGVQMTAKGLRRGREIELGVQWAEDAVRIVVFVGDERIDREGLDVDRTELAAAVEALLDQGGAYR